MWLVLDPQIGSALVPMRYVPLLPRESKQTRSVIGSFLSSSWSSWPRRFRGTTSIIINMSAPGEATLPPTRRARKSIGVHTELSRKENNTIDVGGSLAASRKSRSKSIGPGGLDALRQGTGNRRAVWMLLIWSPRAWLITLYSLSLCRPNCLARF